MSCFGMRARGARGAAAPSGAAPAPPAPPARCADPATPPDAHRSPAADAAGPVTRSRAAAPVPPPALSEEEAYERAMRPLLFDEAPLVATHAFATEAKHQGCAGGELQRQRATRIATELAALRDALPCHFRSCVAVRVDAGCADMLRALILGADGTPYAGGAFLFDILLPAAYPSAAPLVRFLTTGGGAWRANPNLYNSGHVCLSLLGTWSGPGWDAQRSSLLQLLVSLQGLVLSEHPYYNEPGYESLRGHRGAYPACRDYTHGCRAGTLQHAVAAPACELAAGGGGCASSSSTAVAAVFAPLLHEHFARKASALRACADAWEAEAAADGASPNARLVAAAAAKARAALQQLPPLPPLPLPPAAAAAADAKQPAAEELQPPGTPPAAAARRRRGSRRSSC